MKLDVNESSAVSLGPSIGSGDIITSTEAVQSTTTQPAPLNASLLHTILTTSRRTIPSPDSPEIWGFSYPSDHMVNVNWTISKGWAAPELRPYGPFSIMPTASCLHYATQAFEGMKCFRGYDGKLRLFRPDLNCKRMVNSVARVALPVFDSAELEKLIAALLKVDGPRWLPKASPGKHLYLRPAMIANGEQIGVTLPTSALLFILAVPWPDLSGGAVPPGAAPKPPGLKLLASKENSTRAWPGGFGSSKVGANYGPAFVAHGEALAAGFDQILWLFGKEAQVTEAGASNFFVVWRTEGGDVELVTAPLGEKIILEGVTRSSILDLARERLENSECLKVVERVFTMFEIVEAEKQGRLVEAFVSGTAFFVTPVRSISFQGTQMDIPIGTEGCGKYAALFRKWLGDIMFGREQHEWGVVVEESD